MIKQLLPALRMTVLLAIFVGLIFPCFITLISQVVFPEQAKGSLVRDDKGDIVGSKLLAQSFIEPKYFHSRPSAAGSGYAGETSGATNLGPTSSKLINGVQDDPATKADESFAGVKQLAEKYRTENGVGSEEPVPADAVTRSASGLDPDISQENAMMQATRVAKVRGIGFDKISALVKRNTVERDLGIFGEPHVNVLLLNRSLDKMVTEAAPNGI